VEAAGGIGVEEIADGLTAEWGARVIGNGARRGQQGRHRRAHGLGPRPVVGQRGIVERGSDRILGAQLFGEEGRVVLIAESEGRAMGYLSGVQLGRTLGIEELAVLPEFRRMGIGRALVAQALAKEQGAVLSVSESNKPARALYKSLGFTQTARRLIFEKRT